MKRRAYAFTLVELLATTAAMAILMVALLSIVAMLSRDARKEGSRSPTIDVAAERTLEQLRLDLVNAQVVPVENATDRIDLSGTCSLDAASNERDLRAALVLYRIADLGGHKALVREQSVMVTDEKKETSVSLLLANVTAIALEPFDGKSADPASPKQRPHGYQVSLTWSDGRQTKKMLLLD